MKNRSTEKDDNVILKILIAYCIWSVFIIIGFVGFATMILCGLLDGEWAEVFNLYKEWITRQ